MRIDKRDQVLEYGYLTTALWGEANFFENTEKEKHSFTV
jgi:hypothetical protein